MPHFSIFFIMISLSAIALPSTGGFVAEFFVLLGAFMAKSFGALVLSLMGVVLSAGYMLYLIHRVFFGKVTKLSQKTNKLSSREMGIILPFVFLVFFLGIFPKVFWKYSLSSLEHIKNKHYLVDHE